MLDGRRVAGSAVTDVIRHPDGAELQLDVGAASWIVDRLVRRGRGTGTPVCSVVPAGYAAYVRLFHGAVERVGETRVERRWSDLALRANVRMHPAVQFERFDCDASVRLGTLGHRDAAILVEVLRRHSATPDSCLLAIWEGYGELSGGVVPLVSRRRILDRLSRRWRAAAAPNPPPVGLTSAPRVSIPARDYYLYRGSIDLVPRFEFMPGRLQTPNMWWPEDRAWFVGSEIDFDSTLIACDRACADALLSSDLETLEVAPETRLDIEGDVINPSS